MNKNPLSFPLEYLFIGIVLLVAIAIFTMYLLESKKRYEKFKNSKPQPQIIMFYTTWCGHSRKMKPIFKEVKNELVTIDKTKNKKKLLKDLVDFKLVDCDSDSDNLCSLFKIKYLPTIILIKDGKKINYTGGPNLEKLYLFLKKELIN